MTAPKVYFDSQTQSKLADSETGATTNIFHTLDPFNKNDMKHRLTSTRRIIDTATHNSKKQQNQITNTAIVANLEIIPWQLKILTWQQQFCNFRTLCVQNLCYNACSFAFPHPLADKKRVNYQPFDHKFITNRLAFNQ